MQHRAALDAVLAGVEVEAAVHDLIGNACEIAWSERVDALRECVRVCAARAAALEAEREAERVLQLRRAFEAEELKQKFELELWELAKQLQESKRVESELLASRMREDELQKQVEAARSSLLTVEVALSRLRTRASGEPMFSHLKSSTFVIISTFLEASDVYLWSCTCHSLSSRITNILRRQLQPPDEFLRSKTGRGFPMLSPSSASSFYSTSGPVEASTPPLFNGLDPKTMAALAKGSKQQKAVVKRIEQLEASVQTARLENQDILEKLRASDASKEGIWRQLQQMEVTVRAAQLAKDHAEAQSLADKEVITYLDSRLRELEEAARLAQVVEQPPAVVEEPVVDAEEVVTELKIALPVAVVVPPSLPEPEPEPVAEPSPPAPAPPDPELLAKIAALEETVAQLSLEKQEIEATSKSQKKLLVAEVKKLRATIQQLEDPASRERLSSATLAPP